MLSSSASSISIQGFSTADEQERTAEKYKRSWSLIVTPECIKSISVRTGEFKRQRNKRRGKEKQDIDYPYPTLGRVKSRLEYATTHSRSGTLFFVQICPNKLCLVPLSFE